MTSGMEAAEPAWASLIAKGASTRQSPIPTTRHIDPILPLSASRPQLMECGGEEHAVKFKQNNHGDGRGIAIEQVMGLLGELLAAPVPVVNLVDVPTVIASDLIQLQDAAGNRMLDFDPEGGVHHGSRWVDGFGGREEIAYVDENEDAFAALHVLFTWAGKGADQQFIYRTDSPHDVMSVDHSAFLGGWDAASLDADTGPIQADPKLDPVDLPKRSFQRALSRLAAVDPPELAAVVARPPDEWGLTAPDREALASYLFRRMKGVADLLAGEGKT